MRVGEGRRGGGGMGAGGGGGNSHTKTRNSITAVVKSAECCVVISLSPRATE